MVSGIAKRVVAAGVAAALCIGMSGTARAQTCPKSAVAQITTSQAADAYLAERFGGLEAPSLPVFAARDWLGCQHQQDVQRRALELASEQAVAEVAEVLLTGQTATAMRQSVGSGDAKGLFGVLFHPSVMAHLVTADPAQVAGWDALAEALEAAYAGPEGLTKVGGRAQGS